MMMDKKFIKLGKLNNYRDFISIDSIYAMRITYNTCKDDECRCIEHLRVIYKEGTFNCIDPERKIVYDETFHFYTEEETNEVESFLDSLSAKLPSVGEELSGGEIG